MKQKLVYFLGALFVVQTLVLVKPAQAGWVIKMKNQSQYEESHDVLYLQDNIMKVVEDNQTFIFNGKTRELFFINPQERIYWHGNVDEFKKMMKEFQTKAFQMASQQMEESMKNLSPEQQAIMKEAMKGMKGMDPLAPNVEKKDWQVEYHRTGDVATIAGFVARKYLLKVDGELKEEVWLAENLISKEDWDPKFFKDFMQSMNQQGGEISYEFTDAYWEFAQKGFPLKTITFENDEEEVEIAEEVIEKKFPASMFAPPSDFREVSLDELWQQVNQEMEEEE